MKTVITVIVLCVFAYTGVGAMLKTVGNESEHTTQVNSALAQLEAK